MKPRAIYRAAVDYAKRNPEEVRRAALDATRLRFGVPLEALRWGVTRIGGGKSSPKDVELKAVPPALHLAMTLDAVGTPVRVEGALRIDSVAVAPDSLRITFHLNDLKLALVGDSIAPVALLIKSGALDLSKPGNLLKYLPKKPAAILETDGDRIVVDLMLIPKLAEDARVRSALAVIAPVLGIAKVETERDHVYVTFRAALRGVPEALRAARGLVKAMRG